jgi:uroporphyrinogen III methyltransferase / synthase
MRIVVTRPEQAAAELVGRLEALGHEVGVCPLIEIEPLGEGPIDVSGYDWVVVTSRVGATLLADRVRGAWPAVAAIGPGTAEALRERGVEPALVASVSTQEGLVAEFPPDSGRVLFAGAEGARAYLAEQLGADVQHLYRTVELRPAEPLRGDLVVLASASAARAYGALALDIAAVSIGPETTRAARAAGVRVAAEAESHDMDGLVAAVRRACSSPS